MMATKLSHFRVVFVWATVGLSIVMATMAYRKLTEGTQDAGYAEWVVVSCGRCGRQWEQLWRPGEAMPSNLKQCFECMYDDMCEEGLIQMACLSMLANALEHDRDNQDLIAQMDKATKEFEAHLESCDSCKSHFDRMEKLGKNKPR